MLTALDPPRMRPRLKKMSRSPATALGVLMKFQSRGGPAARSKTALRRRGQPALARAEGRTHLPGMLMPSTRLMCLPASIRSTVTPASSARRPATTAPEFPPLFCGQPRTPRAERQTHPHTM